MAELLELLAEHQNKPLHPLPGHGGGITQHGDWLQALDLPSALVQQTGQFPVHVGIAPVLTKTRLTGLAKPLNRPPVGMQPERVPVNVFMEEPTAARCDALGHTSKEGLQLGQEHGHPAAPDQIEGFFRPGIAE